MISGGGFKKIEIGIVYVFTLDRYSGAFDGVLLVSTRLTVLVEFEFFRELGGFVCSL